MAAVIGLLIGIALAAVGLYYLVKEKHDRDSVKIYRIVVLVGMIISLAVIIKIAVAGV